MRRVILLFVMLVLIVQPVSDAFASTGNNTGFTGLWEYPTADMPDDGVGRFGYTKASPYGYYFIDIAWLPWLEINTRLTTFNSVYTQYRRYMDKAMDIKAVLWDSKDSGHWIIPSIAIGVTDIMGTELMKAQFMAATWHFGKVGATIGYGTDRLNGLYGGLEADINNWLALKAEYSPLDYAQDKVGSSKVVNDIPTNKERYNLGAVIRTHWGMEGSASWQRGGEWAFSISQTINLNKTLSGSNPYKIYDAPGFPRCPTWDNTSKDQVMHDLKEGITEFLRVRDVDIAITSGDNGHSLTVAYENYGYSSHAEAMVRMLVVLSAVMPELDELVLVQKNAGIPIVKASFPGSMLFDIRARSMRKEDFMNSAVFSWAGDMNISADENILVKKAQHEVKAMLVYEPRIDQTLKTEYMDRADIDLIYNGRYSHGWDGVIDIRFPFYLHADTSDRTGLWWEKDFNDKVRIQQTGLTYANNFGKEGRFWLFGEGGYLDEEWFGSNIWARYYSSNGIFWIGGHVTALHDRDPYSFGGLSEGRMRYYRGRFIDRTKGSENDEWRFAQWVQVGANIPGLDVDIEADYGKYADEDTGYKIAVTRHWDDAALGFWMIDTDVDAPDKSFSRAGVHMEIPAEKWFGSWFGRSSAHVWEQDTGLLSTWDMESAREGGHIRTPNRLMDQLRPASMRRNVEHLLREYYSYDDDDERDKEMQEVTGLLNYLVK